jgi:hypothetical protein
MGDGDWIGLGEFGVSEIRRFVEGLGDQKLNKNKSALSPSPSLSLSLSHLPHPLTYWALAQGRLQKLCIFQ